MNSQASRSRWSVWLAAGLLVALAAVGGAAFWHRLQVDPRFPVLLPQHGAQWIRYDREFRFYALTITDAATQFRTTFEVRQPAPEAVLRLCAYRSARVYLDDLPLSYSGNQLASWKDPIRIPIGQHCPPGRHELRVVVLNRSGPPALLAWCDEFAIRTGPHWEAQEADANPRPARTLEHSPSTKLSASFPTVPEVLRAQWPLLLTVFGVVFVLTLLAGWKVLPPSPLASRHISSPALIRYLLLVLWLAMGINNYDKLPIQRGFDASEHREYIRWLVEKEELPYANDGWQMFQTPLYYIVSAAVALALYPITDADFIWRLLRLIPFACGALQVEWCYRALRHAFPNRNDLQCLGLVVGGLMPMNIYIAFSFSNEPMSGMFSALTVLWTVKALRQPALAQTLWWPSVLGLLLGLSILSKFTSVLLIPLLAVCVVLLVKPRSAVRIGTSLLAYAGVTCLVCGWYFVRNVLKFGKPFVGGWDPIRTIEWWQDPGYRSLDQIFSFGQSLVRPIYSATEGFLDGMYSTFWLDGYLNGSGFAARPPWNYSFVIGLAGLSLLPSTAILLGMCSAFRQADRGTRQILLFSAACVGIYMAATFYLFLTLPIVSTTKSTYLVGIIPCFAILCAGGLDWLTRRLWLRAATYGWMACWAVFAYLGYFAITPP